MRGDGGERGYRRRPRGARAAASARSATVQATTHKVALTPVSVPSPAVSAAAQAPAPPQVEPDADPDAIDLEGERRVAEAMFVGDYARALDACDGLAAAHPSASRYGAMVRVLRAKAARVRK